MPERRCPRCGALVAADAEWCGQCLAMLPGAAATGPAPRRPGAATTRLEPPADGDGPPTRWRCPTCDAANDLGANVCGTCGTPFGRLFEPPPVGSSVSPAAAATWSLLLPGLGHWFAGRKAEAVARFVLTAWVIGMLAVLLSSRSGKDGLGMAAALVALFGLAALSLWAEGVVDARRTAAGLPPVVTSRMLLWACVGLVGLSILLATVLTLPGLRFGSSGPVR